MNITYFDHYTGLGEHAADLFMAQLKEKRDALVCCATGGSPQGLYERLSVSFQKDRDLFGALRILKLDEWGGIPMSDPNSCHAYLQQYVLTPLKISGDRYIAFDSEANNVEEECKRVQQVVDRAGPIDFCILGLGKNGHLGFNEPAPFLQRDCHVAKLAPLTVQHSMVQTMPTTPTFGMTIGLHDILNAKKILLLITGAQKQETIKKLMTREITTQLPASLLWLHPRVECLIDRTSL